MANNQNKKRHIEKSEKQEGTRDKDKKVKENRKKRERKNKPTWKQRLRKKKGLSLVPSFVLLALLGHESGQRSPLAIVWSSAEEVHEQQERNTSDQAPESAQKTFLEQRKKLQSSWKIQPKDKTHKSSCRTRENRESKTRKIRQYPFGVATLCLKWLQQARQVLHFLFFFVWRVFCHFFFSH